MTLLEQAYLIPCNRWREIDALIEAAPDAPTAAGLRLLQKFKYLQEEGHSGCL